MMAEQIIELRRLQKNCDSRRTILWWVGEGKLKLKRRLSALSGILALFSAGAISMVPAQFTSEGVWQIIAAISAAVSGLIILIITAFHSDDDIKSISIGTSEYLALRNKMTTILFDEKMTSDKRLGLITEIMREYAELDKTYTQYLKIMGMSDYIHHADSDDSGMLSDNLGFGERYYFGSATESDVSEKGKGKRKTNVVKPTIKTVDE
jgi:hypothetical protein